MVKRIRIKPKSNHPRLFTETGAFAFDFNNTRTILVKPANDGILASRGAFTLTGRVATVTAGPTWSQTVPAISFTEDNATDVTRDLTQYTTGFSSNLHEFQLFQGTLPSGVSLNATGSYTYDGTSNAASASNIVIRIANKTTSSAQADWLARSTQQDVRYATDFSGPNDFVRTTTDGGHVHNDPNNWVVKDTTDGLTNGCCLRIDSPASNSTGTHSWTAPLSSAWTLNSQHHGLGVPFWIQFRFKIPSSRLVPSNVSGQRGWKLLNVAQYANQDTDSFSFSNSQAEHVLQDTDEFGLLQAYHNPGFEGFYGTAGGQLSLQNSIDRGVLFTGGSRYCWWNSGDPTLACEFWTPGEWVTIMLRIKPSSYSGVANASNEFTVWYARKDATSWTQIMHHTNYAIGSPNSEGGGFQGINGLHFSNFETNRVSGQVDTHHKYDQLIVSLSPIALPAVGA